MPSYPNKSIQKGYVPRVNVSNPEIRKRYDAYKRERGIPVYMPLGDKERMEFEQLELERNSGQADTPHTWAKK